MWFIHNPERLKTEVTGIETLRASAPWLAGATPRMMKGLKFAVDFDIVVNGEALPFTLIYPAFFPETPPSVLPRDGRHYSSHQWGHGGEFCLEYRTDNWDPAVTGAMMIESVFRLLSGEQPALNRRAVVPSAHQASLGQQLRSTSCRAFLTRGLRDCIAALESGYSYPCNIVETLGPRRTWTAYVASIGPVSTPVWREDSIPPGDSQGSPGLLVRLPSLDGVVVSEQEHLDCIVTATAIQGQAPADDNATSRFTVLADATGAQFFFSFFHDGTWKVLRYRAIDVSDETGTRLPDSYAAIAGKKVGIVGCGSLGSKIAASLARSGVRQFVLIDDDILKPGNLARNELGAESLGAHKADALEERLRAVAPNVTADVWRVDLGGQESSGSTATILDALAGCDLLIDATADPQAFNFVASVARRARSPMIWAEVYAGGIGGFVARLRPGIEPPPHAARRQYLAWCRSQGTPWHGQGDDYDARRDDEPPLIADDADVAVIAAHTSRMAVDVLVRCETSIFPHPAYVIGLAADWVFDEPFDTRPVDFSAEGEWQLPVSGEQAGAALEYVVSLLDKADDADRTGT
ncbi:ThiF family adenylyltransferase [Roseixanthobacter glucoisosaccharinicivorans]|uniref:ThiF family adenylyltransferase n=1 Tax=Roseixanthobacter glucoisosaccharinicivorans TaxID=3119923 RepID=UPI003726C360